ncbi:hypothetical protein ACQP3C_28140, partial [Escherichia coli]
MENVPSLRDKCESKGHPGMKEKCTTFIFVFSTSFLSGLQEMLTFQPVTQKLSILSPSFLSGLVTHQYP